MGVYMLSYISVNARVWQLQTLEPCLRVTELL
jgi:hypothetical protein